MAGTGVDQPGGGNRLTARPGTAADQQARLAGLDLQQLALFGISQNRFDYVLALGQGSDLRQIGVGRLQREVLLQVVRRHLGIYETVLNLHGNLVFVMHDQ